MDTCLARDGERGAQRRDQGISEGYESLDSMGLQIVRDGIGTDLASLTSSTEAEKGKPGRSLCSIRPFVCKDDQQHTAGANEICTSKGIASLVWAGPASGHLESCKSQSGMKRGSSD